MTLFNISFGDVDGSHMTNKVKNGQQIVTTAITTIIMSNNDVTTPKNKKRSSSTRTTATLLLLSLLLFNTLHVGMTLKNNEKFGKGSEGNIDAIDDDEDIHDDRITSGVTSSVRPSGNSGGGGGGNEGGNGGGGGGDNPLAQLSGLLQTMLKPKFNKSNSFVFNFPPLIMGNRTVFSLFGQAPLLGASSTTHNGGLFPLNGGSSTHFAPMPMHHAFPGAAGAPPTMFPQYPAWFFGFFLRPRPPVTHLAQSHAPAHLVPIPPPQPMPPFMPPPIPSLIPPVHPPPPPFPPVHPPMPQPHPPMPTTTEMPPTTPEPSPETSTPGPQNEITPTAPAPNRFLFPNCGLTLPQLSIANARYGGGGENGRRSENTYGTGTTKPKGQKRQQKSYQPKQPQQRYRTQTRIVGGRDTLIDQIPWQVSLQRPKSHMMRHFCGGSVIHPQWILTAAHCLDWALRGRNIMPVLRTLKVIAGANTIRSLASPYQPYFPMNPFFERRVMAAFIYPGYIKSKSNNDIALLRLDRPLPLFPLSKINTICLPAVNQQVDNYATTSGWGQTTEGGSQSIFLKSVNVSVVNNSVCQDAYGNNFNAEQMICAGDHGKDSCQGDSGGPLFQEDNTIERNVQVGITSFGYGCGRNGFPGIYTRVPSYVDWIVGTIQGNVNAFVG